MRKAYFTSPPPMDRGFARRDGQQEQERARRREQRVGEGTERCLAAQEAPRHTELGPERCRDEGGGGPVQERAVRDHPVLKVDERDGDEQQDGGEQYSGLDGQ